MILFWLIPAAYVLFTLLVFLGLILKHKPQAEKRSDISVDILIPFKDEAENLPELLDSLLDQKDASNKISIYFINDHSSDNSVRIIMQYQQKSPDIHLLENSGSGKKSALITGFNASRGEVILLTDADTIISSDWIQSHIRQYDPETDMLIGPVEMLPLKHKIWHHLQVLEYKSIQAVTVGLGTLNLPVMCSAANLSFRRSAVSDIRKALNLNYRSGDDMFLLHHFKSERKKICINHSVVRIKTEPFNKFLQQRIRWSEKAKGYNDFMILVTGLLVMLMNLLIPATFTASFFANSLASVFLILFSIKILSDTLVILPLLKKSELSLLWLLIPLSILYPFYAVGVAVAGFLKPEHSKGW
ncbi:glycosyltransferase [Saccharicrinis sp. FJH54]|uniref:glycosyltransferase n=1 Tax=Saccharicrinis sp. FJH54 TaxID=3344665 RepID=UPI0035D5153E